MILRRAVAAMAEINESSSRIADIIGVIDEIAFQTNLLALNAAVEAARAGEQGRGFAVVASEVRNLAQRSAGAAKEIKTLINESMEKVKVGAALVNDSGQAIAQIMDSAKRVTDIVSEIASANDEQASGIEQVNRAVAGMENTTQQNAALVEEAAAAGKAMDSQTQHLVLQVGFFKADEEARRAA
jgi:methyl-accepting chemotaxis protein-1 (serine sensor receptor)